MSEVLTNLSDALAGAVQTGDASVVRVEGRRRLAASGIAWAGDVVVTANHVVERDEELTVGLPDGRPSIATLVGRDPTTDLAVLRLADGDLTPANWQQGGDLRVGHLVLALGRPGRTVQATLGIVSALGESWRTGAGGEVDRYLQTDAVMYPGFSGGPLVDAAGQLHGLNSSALLRGVSVAIPAATIARVVDTLLTHGRVRRGYLGVGAQPVRLPEALAQSLDQSTGLMLVSVEPGSPAEKGGLHLGDTIVSLGSEPIRQIDDLLGLLAGDRVGESVALKVYRGGEVQDVAITVGERE